MKNLVTKLLDIWYACLVVDHHKDRDCHFYIENRLSAYGKERWVVYHDGYLCRWEYDEDSYEKCLARLSNELKDMIEQECNSYIEQEGNTSWQTYSDSQIKTMKNNLNELRELLDNEET